MKIRPYSRIVIEGMDGSGKSTLMNHLMEFLGDTAEYVPGYNRIPNPKPEMDQWWMEYLGHNPIGRVVVHDRFFYPELVYGPTLRGYVAASATTVNYVQNFLRTHAFLIYCRPPTNILWDGANVEHQMKGVLEMFNDLLIAYDRMVVQEAPFYKGRFVKYNWTDENAFSKLVHELTGYIYE